MLYHCCSNEPAIIGRVKRNNVPVMPPRVRSPFRNMIVHTLSQAMPNNFTSNISVEKAGIGPLARVPYPTVYGM